MLSIYEKVRAVPQEAKKSIGGGRLKGMTDINPMWRIKILTETFGPVGIGWYYEVLKQWIEDGPIDTGEKVAFCNINLFVKVDGDWSKPIFGTGGSMFVAKERNGLFTSDEAFKMALTDSISVSCKQLGIGADVYWEKDKSKYNQEDKPKEDPPKLISQTQLKTLTDLLEAKKFKPDGILTNLNIESLDKLNATQYATLLKKLQAK